jgi:hypothetical protein
MESTTDPKESIRDERVLTEKVLNEEVVNLHEALIDVLGGPPPGGELEDLYWYPEDDEFQSFVDRVIKETSSWNADPSGRRADAARGDQADAKVKAAGQKPTAS